MHLLLLATPVPGWVSLPSDLLLLALLLMLLLQLLTTAARP